MLITIPVLILFFAFNTLPLIKGFIYSFTNFKGYGSYEWVGLRNYIDLFQDARVGKSYLFTFKFAIVATIIVNVISLILALGLNSKIRAKSALRGIYFIPNVLGGLVVGYIFSFIFTYILPTIGENLGIGFLKSSMLASTKSAWFAIVIVAAWQAIAMNTIIYISGLQTVPEDVYEAGANRRCNRMEQVQKPYFSADHSFFYHKYGSLHEKLPHGIRPDHVFDKGWSGTEYRVYFLSYLQKRNGWRTVWFPECECSTFLRSHCCNFCIPAYIYE